MIPNTLPKIMFAVSILTGIFILYPATNYQPFLAQGDHGRDLYAFEQTICGSKVYKDYWWVYGPFMPVYYSWFDRLLGVSIHSVLIGKMILQLLSGLFIYLSLGLFFSPLCAFTGAVWFWVFNEDFFFTYNHAGGITMVTAVVLCTLLYLQNRRTRYLLAGLAGSFLLAMIKLNFGICAWLILTAATILIDAAHKSALSATKRYFYFAAFMFPVLVFFSYWFYLHGLSIYEIRQCLPFMKGDQPYETSLWSSARSYIMSILHSIKSSWANAAFALILILSLGQTARITLRDKNKSQLLVIIILLGYLLMNAHEFLMSGVLYRVYWIRPLQVLLIFSLIAIAVQNFSKIIQAFLFCAIFTTAFITFYSQLQPTAQIKIPRQYLSHPKGKIYVGNHPSWIDTVNQTTTFLSKHLSRDETFFALPYDCLYYYLTGKTSPTRQLIFFEHIKIPAEQEHKIIADLERNHVNWVVASSRIASQEHGLGVLGQTYCPVIGKYLEDNFAVAARFGDWTNAPGWAWNHGTKILKRKNPL